MKTKFFFALLIFIFTAGTAFAGPYAPAAGVAGSTAIHMDDASFLSWATGWENYNLGTNVDLTWQTPDKATGKAVGTSFDIVSLGRGGEITMTFGSSIFDGAGDDFAVFENSFSDTFLELGYVEVSSDGTNFFRFDNDSLTSGTVGGFGAVDPTDITGYASKYRQGYGTPFDLADLAGTTGLDIYDIGYVKIVDIIGDGTYLDTSGDVIYEPYPTVGSAGFDLDAIGVMHAVPVPGAIWLIGSAFLAIAGFKRKRN